VWRCCCHPSALLICSPCLNETCLQECPKCLTGAAPAPVRDQAMQSGPRDAAHPLQALHHHIVQRAGACMALVTRNVPAKKHCSSTMHAPATKHDCIAAADGSQATHDTNEAQLQSERPSAGGKAHDAATGRIDYWRLAPDELPEGVSIVHGVLQLGAAPDMSDCRKTLLASHGCTRNTHFPNAAGPPAQQWAGSRCAGR
jgi:hypothetical protein